MVRGIEEGYQMEIEETKYPGDTKMPERSTEHHARYNSIIVVVGCGVMVVKEVAWCNYEQNKENET